jgi:RNA polymerase sigma-70 factor (ECF subfamily)
VTEGTSGLSGRQVFEILVREHADMLHAFLRSLLRSSHAVDDVFQETMLTAWRRLADYDPRRPFGPWLRGIATKLVLRHRERDARAHRELDPAILEALEHRFAAAAPTADECSSLGERLRHCVALLPDKLRAAIALVYEHGLRTRTVAARLQASEEAVRKRVQRARQLLAECLRRAGAAT